MVVVFINPEAHEKGFEILTSFVVQERIEYYHIICFERIIPDWTDLLRKGYLKRDGWIAAPPGSGVAIECSTQATLDWFQYEGRTFDIACYERFRRDHEAWKDDWSSREITHQILHEEQQQSDECSICEGLPELKEPKRSDYFPENPSIVSLSRLLEIISKQPHIDEWWRFQNPK